MYCERCRLVFDGGKCPECGKKSKRDVEPDDACFLTEQPQIFSDMLTDILEQNSIPYYTKGVYGAGLAIKIGPVNERFRIYVLYRDLERAGDIVTGLFESPVDDPAGLFADQEDQDTK